MNQDNLRDRETKVMTEADKRNFEGVTIDEHGNAYDVNDTPSREDERQYYTQDNPNFKVYTLSGTSLIKKLIIGAIVIGVLTLIFIFGGFILVGFAVVAVIGVILSILGGLF